MIKQLFDQLFSMPNPIDYAIPFFIVSLFAEWWITWRENQERYNVPDAISSVLLGLGSLLFDIPGKLLALYVYNIVYTHRLFDIPFAFWSIILVFLLDDFSYYWFHRWEHEHRFLWAAHENHHSSQHYNLATALRQSWVAVIYKYSLWAWIVWLGFPPIWVFVAQAVSLIYQYWIHTELIAKLPTWFEAVFNTASHHRVHHGSNIRYLDKNHGGILIIWDKLFGTFEPETEEVVYGLTQNINTNNVFKIAFHEYYNLWQDIKKAPTFADKFRYFWNPPGWSHDGSKLTTKQLRQKNRI